MRSLMSRGVLEAAHWYGRNRRGADRLIELAMYLDSGQSRPACVRVDDSRFLVDPAFGDIDRDLYYRREVDSVLRSTVERFCAPGTIAVDAGANVGYATVLMAGRVGPAGRVLAFEPSDRFAQKLAANLTVNGLENVEIRRLALSDQQTELSICVSRSTASAVYRYQDGVLETVPAGPLDSQIDFHAIAQLSFIKIDVEGLEIRCLKGGARTLARFRPVLLVEVSPRNLAAAGASVTDLFSQISSAGYRIVDPGTLRPRSLDDLLSHGASGKDDVLCLPN